jgi:hypothetical protein
VVLHTVVQDYTVVSHETIAHYIVVLLQTAIWDCIVAIAQCYTMVVVKIFLFLVQPAPCMYL